MFWILRRTRLGAAASFFNAINNNSNASGNTAATAASSTANAGSRPGRKQGYNKLHSGEEAADVNDNLELGQESASHSDTDSTCSGAQEHPEHTDSDCDESLTCNVCDRSFSTARMLAHHQQKKRHFGCSACDSLFPSLMALEHHKEEFEHWSGEESLGEHSESGHDDSSDGTVTSEELERLL